MYIPLVICNLVFAFLLLACPSFGNEGNAKSVAGMSNRHFLLFTWVVHLDQRLKSIFLLFRDFMDALVQSSACFYSMHTIRWLDTAALNREYEIGGNWTEILNREQEIAGNTMDILNREQEMAGYCTGILNRDREMAGNYTGILNREEEMAGNCTGILNRELEMGGNWTGIE